MTDPPSTPARYRPDAAPREIIARDPQRSFRCIVHDFPSDICGWASHPEYEIHLIQKSSGSVIAGDYVGTFGPGHVSLMGPHLPHDWVSDIAPGEVVVGRDVVVHFTDEWVRDCMALMPELGNLDRLLQASARGLEFGGATAAKARPAILGLVHSRGPAQIARMFEVLGLLAEAPDEDCVPLASAWLGTTDNAFANQAAEAGKCNAFGIPLVVLVDTPGYMPGTRQEGAGVIRHGASLVHAFAEAEGAEADRCAPEGVRRRVHHERNSKDLGADFVFAWPTAEIGVMGGAQPAVGIIHRRELAGRRRPRGRPPPAGRLLRGDTPAAGGGRARRLRGRADRACGDAGAARLGDGALR